MELLLEAVNTFVLIVTAYIVYWYTDETQKLRKSSEEQTRSFIEQISMFKTQQGPTFVPAGRDSVNGRDWGFKVRNIGGLATDLQISCAAASTARIVPRFLRRDEIASVHLSFPHEVPLHAEFILTCQDSIGSTHMRTFLFSRDEGPSFETLSKAA